MQQVLKISTAATTIVGPILDSTGAAYTGAAIGDLNITKNGTTAAMAAAATLTHDHNGHYLLLFTTGNTDTLGRLDITCNKATYAMPPKVFEVLSATTFDALVTNAAGAAGGMLYNGANTGAVLPRVTLVDTITTYTGDTPQTGDSFARIGATGSGLTSLAPSSTALSTSQWTNLRAGYLDNINNSALQTTVAQTGDSYARIGSAGVGLTNLGDTRIANLDATVSSRGTSTLTQSQVTGGAYALNSSSFAFNAALPLTTQQKADVNTEADTAASDYGALKPTTASRTLDVSATGEAGLDFDNIKDATGAHTLTNITVPVVTTTATATNLTNAPTAGDFTSTMKTSLNAATPAVTVSDKTGFALTAAYDPAKTAAQAGDAMALTSGERTTLSASIWDKLTSAITTTGSIGKWILDKLDVVLSTRLASSSYTAPPTAAVVAQAVYDHDENSDGNALGLMIAQARDNTEEINTKADDAASVLNQFVFTTPNKVDATADATLTQDNIDDIAAGVISGLGGGDLTFRSPTAFVAPNFDVALKHGTDYVSATGRLVSFAIGGIPAPTAVRWEFRRGRTVAYTITGAYATSGSGYTISAPLTRTDLDGISNGQYSHAFVTTHAGGYEQEIASGKVVVV